MTSQSSLRSGNPFVQQFARGGVATEAIAAGHRTQTVNPPHHLGDRPTLNLDERRSAKQATAEQTVTEMRVDSPAATSFRPAWEMEAFELPPTVADLFLQGGLLHELAEKLGAAIDGGLKSMMVTSLHAGNGRSTVAIGMALSAAAGGRRVALVDADLNSATLADELNVEPQFGWNQAIRGEVLLSETAIEAREDGVILFPLLNDESQAAAIEPAEVVALAERLSDHFDLILIDAGASDSTLMYQFAPAIDSAIVVRDMSDDDSRSLKAFCGRLSESGIKGIGLVENFAS